MWNYLKSPLVYISFSLSMLTISLLLMSEFLGFIPDTKAAEIQSRKVITESVALIVSNQVLQQRNVNIVDLENLFSTIIKRNPSIISAAVRNIEGEFLVNIGEHDKHWSLEPGKSSTSTQLQISYYRNSLKFGNVEIVFSEIDEQFSLSSPFIKAILFISLMSFLLFVFFLKRSLRELNPDNVIPERVSKALNTFSEGLIMIDNNGTIVFSNHAFTSKTGMAEKQLFGKKINQFDWRLDKQDADQIIPWLHLKKNVNTPSEYLQSEHRIHFLAASNKSYIFNTKSSPIIANDGKVNGVLITLDDISEIELKNAQLNQIIIKLQSTQLEIEKQNKELHVLATRDPLTGSLNRRAFFQNFQQLFKESVEFKDKLCCIMIDIDHFKRVNDNYGHPEGDRVIKYVSNILHKNSRSNDFVGRFGGEEFCIILPNIELDSAFVIAENIRKSIEAGEERDYDKRINFTVSLGISYLTDKIEQYDILLEQADRALYYAKDTGRNNTVKWTAEIEDKIKAISQLKDSSIQITSKLRNSEREGHSKPGVDLLEPEKHKIPQNDIVQQSNVADVSTPISTNIESANKRLILLDRIDQSIFRAERMDTKIAIMAIDFDILKRVSDTLGFSANQKLARIITGQIKELLRHTDTAMLFDAPSLNFSISITSTSNITILLTDLQKVENVTLILQRILTLGEQVINIEGNDILLSLTTGISVYPYDGNDSQTLLRNASIATRLTQNKIGRNNYNFYSKHHNVESRHQIRIEGELYKAIERDELIVYYQPIVDLKTGQIDSLEALIRWEHPELGLIPPDEFIPVAENSGLIETISFKVIESVCKQLTVWTEYDFTVAINLSTVDFKNEDLAERIIKMVSEYNIDCSKLMFEVTESIAIQQIDETNRILLALKEAGFTIALDDFGTGYSSLRYIKQFPIDKIKIDRSFISKIISEKTDAALVSAIIAMGHRLGLLVVAEGVEDEQQLNLLQDLNCDQMQGYFMSKPLPSGEISEWIIQSTSVSEIITNYSNNNNTLNDISKANNLFNNEGLINTFSPEKHNRKE